MPTRRRRLPRNVRYPSVFFVIKDDKLVLYGRGQAFDEYQAGNVDFPSPLVLPTQDEKEDFLIYGDEFVRELPGKKSQTKPNAKPPKDEKVTQAETAKTKQEKGG